MKFKIIKNWGETLVNENGVKLENFNMLIALDLSTSKHVFIVQDSKSCHEHGSSGAHTSYRIVCSETDRDLNEYELGGNKYEKNYLLEIQVGKKVGENV